MSQYFFIFNDLWLLHSLKIFVISTCFVSVSDDQVQSRQERQHDMDVVNKQVENVQIDSKKPEEYFENLKESMQQSGIRVRYLKAQLCLL